MQNGHIEIQLNPLSQTQAKAFYLGRGFSEEVALQIANSCVYQTVVKNISADDESVSVSVNLADWKHINDTQETNLPAKQTWLDKWAALGASNTALLAFKWATFPSQQIFKLASDYGWGMILFGPDSNENSDEGFDLMVRWQENDTAMQQSIRGLNCPQ